MWQIALRSQHIVCCELVTRDGRLKALDLTTHVGDSITDGIRLFGSKLICHLLSLTFAHLVVRALWASIVDSNEMRGFTWAGRVHRRMAM